MTSVALVDAASVVTFADTAPVRGDAMSSIQVTGGRAVVCDGGAITAVGEARSTDITFDASGCTVIPGFVDCHTHLPFFGWRADEDAARLSGVRYGSLHKQERGIYRSANLLATADDDVVLAFSEGLARQMLSSGTTTFESKSGYGLSVEAELRQLRLAHELAARLPQTVVHTCLAAHAVPPGYSAGEWVGEVATDLLPAAAKEGLATAVDIYVESIAFSLEHAARLAEAARPLGLALRIHADQLQDSQAGSFAARWAFATADHLNHTSAEAAADIAASQTAAVLLPGATFTLRQNKKPPARELIDAGAVVALATDLNPGTSPLHSMPFVIALACRLYGLRPLEALAAATVNGAYALGLHDRVGRLVPGHRADVVVLGVETFDEIPYRADTNPVLAVICGGELAHIAPQAEPRLQRA